MAKKLAKAQLGKEIKTKIRDVRRDIDDRGGIKGIAKMARYNSMDNRLFKTIDKIEAEKKSSSPNTNKLNRLDNKYNRISDRQEKLFAKKGGSIKRRSNEKEIN